MFGEGGVRVAAPRGPPLRRRRNILKPFVERPNFPARGVAVSSEGTLECQLFIAEPLRVGVLGAALGSQPCRVVARREGSCVFCVEQFEATPS